MKYSVICQIQHPLHHNLSLSSLNQRQFHNRSRFSSLHHTSLSAQVSSHFLHNRSLPRQRQQPPWQIHSHRNQQHQSRHQFSLLRQHYSLPTISNQLRNYHSQQRHFHLQFHAQATSVIALFIHWKITTRTTDQISQN